MAASESKPKIVYERPKLSGHVVLFTSLSIIILAFFILLSAVSTPDEERVRQALSSIQLEFAGIFEKTRRLFNILDGEAAGVDLMSGSQVPGQELIFEMLSSRYEDFNSLKRFGREIGLDGLIGIVVTPRGLVITVGEELGFASGDDRLTANGRRFLDRLAAVVGSFRNEIVIEGHSDNSPLPAGSTWASNWGLSQARALRVLEYLNSKGISLDRLSAAGAGEYRPLADNDTPENRARNRRVEIIIKHPRLDRQGEVR